MRLKKNFTQCDVARKVGISLSFYCLIEKKLRKPSVNVAKKIAEVLGFNWIDFYVGTQEKKLKSKTSS